MFERGEQKMQVGRARLLARALADLHGQRPFTGCRQYALPFAVAAVKQQHRVALRKPQDVTQIIGLVAIERNLGPTGKRAIEVDARGAEVVSRHGGNRAQTTVADKAKGGLSRFEPLCEGVDLARFAAFPTQSASCYKRCVDRPRV